MEIMMFAGNDLLESFPLNSLQISQPGYLGHIKRLLKKKHAELLAQFSDEPEFLVMRTAQNQ